MSTGVFNQPDRPMCPEDDLFLSQFFSDYVVNGHPKNESSNPQQQLMSMEQPPEQPMIDSLVYEFSDSTQIVKQEQQSGFLALFSSTEQEFNPDRVSPEDEKKNYSSLVKEELHCMIKLKLLSEGKDFGSEVADNQTAPKEHPISEETKELQRVRREKNREAAKKCRQKKKLTEREQEMRIREAERQVQQLQLQLHHSQREYTGLLDNFKNMPCFLAYLRQNRHLLGQPLIKQELKRFVESHGGQFNSEHQRCCVCPRSAAAAVASQPGNATDAVPQFQAFF